MMADPQYPDSDFSDEDQSPLDISFNKAADHVRKITNKLDNNKLLELYALYKQGTVGSCDTPKPSWFDGTGRKKWEAWKALGDLHSEEAKQRYITLVQQYDPELEIESSPKEAWVAVSSLQYTPEPELDHRQMSILDAARENCGDLVKELLTKNPELKHERDEDGLTALHWSADRDATSSLTAALTGGCLIDAVDESGQTALHYAVSCGHVKSTRILVDAGAALLKDEEGMSPLDLATDDEIKKVLERAK